MNPPCVTLKEWQTCGPDEEKVLANLNFGGCDRDRESARLLTKYGKLEVLELARGLQLGARSYVGRFPLGPIVVVINPKLTGAPLLSLFRYAYGLRHLEMHATVGHSTAQWNFQDLIIRQLVVEVEEIMARGVQRDYVAVEEHLASPRGRFNFGQHLREYPWTEAALPCRHHPRIEDTVLNQTMVSGLRFAASVTSDIDLRGQLNRQRKALGASITEKRLDRHLLAEGERAVDRRTTAYKSVLRILKLLLDGNGIKLDDGEDQVTLPGFLFDMNRFFQAMVSRFLREHLVEGSLHDEYRLKDLYSAAPGNPKRRVPTPRPDFVVMQKGAMAAVLDAKYRDIWNLGLPRDMLYQLSVYALGRTGRDRTATIIYPTLDDTPKEEVLLINDALRGAVQGRVVLRPLNLLKLEGLIRQGGACLRERLALAEWLVYGSSKVG